MDHYKDDDSKLAKLAADSLKKKYEEIKHEQFMYDIFPMQTKETRVQNSILKILFVSCKLNYFWNLLIYKFCSVVDLSAWHV